MFIHNIKSRFSAINLHHFFAIQHIQKYRYILCFLMDGQDVPIDARCPYCANQSIVKACTVIGACCHKRSNGGNVDCFIIRQKLETHLE